MASPTSPTAKSPTFKNASKAKPVSKSIDASSELLRHLRQLCRDLSLPTFATNNNLLLSLVEAAVEQNQPFPPKTLIFTNSIEINFWKLLHQFLSSAHCHAYSSLFKSKKYIGLQTLHIWGIPLSKNELNEVTSLATKIPSLTKLELVQCSLSDQCAESLSDCLKKRSTAYLTTLNLDHNEFSDTGSMVLAQGLGFNSTLTSLNLSHNRIRNCTGIASILSLTDTRLTQLDLAANAINNSGFANICAVLPLSKLQSLNLAQNNINFQMDEEILNDKLNKPQSIENSVSRSLSMTKANELSTILTTTLGETFIIAMSKCKTLRDVNLDANLLSEHFLESLISSLSEARLLHLHNFKITSFVNNSLYYRLCELVEKQQPPKKKKKKNKLKAKQKSSKK